MEPLPIPHPPTSLPSRRSYGAVADTATHLYEMLHITPQSGPEEIEQALGQAQRWWNAQQANPKYRRQAGEALARLREAKEILLDPIRRQEYDRHLQHFRQRHRAGRWQPVQDLIEVMIQDNALCTQEQHDLLSRFAQKRGFSEEEFDALVSQAFLKQGIQVWTPDPPPEVPVRRPLSAAHQLNIAMISGALLGILFLPFCDLSRPAVLLSFPLFNNVRMLLQDLFPAPQSASANGWDWFAGIALFGGATLTALFELSATRWLPVGLASAGLLWLSWGWLFFLQRQDR